MPQTNKGTYDLDGASSLLAPNTQFDRLRQKVYGSSVKMRNCANKSLASATQNFSDAH